jgi:hypothetical protein
MKKLIFLFLTSLPYGAMAQPLNQFIPTQPAPDAS